MQTAYYEDQLRRLYEQHFGRKPHYIKPLASGGSLRKYYRLWADSESAIGTIHFQMEENLAFFNIQKTLNKSGISVPELYGISDDKMCYLQQDLGDENLFSLIEKHRQSTDFDSIVEPLYQKTLSDLVRMQLETHPKMDYSLCWPDAHYGREAILADLNYFYYYFVKQHQQLHYNESSLLKEFDCFANEISQTLPNSLMYRDFQSRNIQIKDGSFYYIDFQGIRKGPILYDAVSLLFQAKASLSDELRKRLLKFYFAQLTEKHGVPEEKLWESLPQFVYLRLFQVLGAYGFRGLIQRKSHFLQSIPYALNELETLHKSRPIPKTYSHMSDLTDQITRLKSAYPVVEKSKQGKLTLRVSSFSYLNKGIPTDLSGNGGGFVFDCRILPNPGRFPEYAGLTGFDLPVIHFLEKEKTVAHFLKHVKAIIGMAVLDYQKRGHTNLMFNFGCTGGRHRSVYCATQISDWLINTYPEVQVITVHHEQQ